MPATRTAPKRLADLTPDEFADLISGAVAVIGPGKLLVLRYDGPLGDETMGSLVAAAGRVCKPAGVHVLDDGSDEAAGE